ncbi:MAG: DUF3037 domain-containing protein [Abitibacteriaceae bacterium]|nr:DUF3037 domain-containing protein [Abditibacteriaceae bacterium]MBV9868146.1 DUF3037 domain-containing protein [Abditibacteriaceae bacterium]
MPDKCTFDYAIIRVVPLVERAEFLNAGVILFCPTQSFLRACIELDQQRLMTLSPTIDVPLVEAHLQTIPLICAGGAAAGVIGQLPQRSRFHWLVAPRSTIIQTSPVHCGVGSNLEKALEELIKKMVRPPLSLRVPTIASASIE